MILGIFKLSVVRISRGGYTQQWQVLACLCCMHCFFVPVSHDEECGLGVAIGLGCLLLPTFSTVMNENNIGV